MDYSRQNGKVITLHTKTEIQNIPLENIFYFECDGSLIQVFQSETDSASYFIGTLGKLETQLAVYGFLRINHKCLVNMKHMVYCKTKTHELHLKNKFSFKVSRRKWHKIKDLHKT